MVVGRVDMAVLLGIEVNHTPETPIASPLGGIFGACFNKTASRLEQGSVFSFAGQPRDLRSQRGTECVAADTILVFSK